MSTSDAEHVHCLHYIDMIDCIELGHGPQVGKIEIQCERHKCCYCGEFTLRALGGKKLERGVIPA